MAALTFMPPYGKVNLLIIQGYSRLIWRETWSWEVITNQHVQVNPSLDNPNVNPVIAFVRNLQARREVKVALQESSKVGRPL